MRKIILPDHEGVVGTMNCHECDGTMYPATTESIYNIQGEEVCVKGIKGWKCQECGEVMLSSAEVKLIENILKT